MALLGKRKILLVPAAILVLGASVWGVAALAKGKKTTLPKEFSVAALKAVSADPGKVFARVHEAMNRTDLTDQQRHELHENVHQVMEAQMNERLDEYFKAPASDRQAILDRQLDEMQAHMREMQQRYGQSGRPNRGDDRRQNGPGDAGPAATGTGGPNVAGGPNGAGGGPGQGWHDRHHGPSTRQERKLHSESHDPDQRAQMMAYRTALRKRAQERGIQMPFGMGPPRGGMGRP
jgi:hypothetical protein